MAGPGAVKAARARGAGRPESALCRGLRPQPRAFLRRSSAFLRFSMLVAKESRM